MRLQTKILAGYLVLVAVICSMAAILVHERGRMREIEAETGEIQEIRRDITVAQRSITTLATLGEGVIGWEEADCRHYCTRRLRTDSLLQELRKQGRNNPYIVMTDYDEVPTAVRSTKQDAEDYIPKKQIEANLFPLLKTLRKRMERHDTPIHERQSAAFREIYRKIRLVAPTNMSVLILGESGTGKEHIAEKIHTMSKRSAGPFVAVDCGLLSKELASSALFGHEKGAFTGAENKKQGFWEEAAGGIHIEHTAAARVP